MSLTRKRKTVTFTLAIFETADTKEDLEDWLISQNPDFVKMMRRARTGNL